MRRVMVVVAGLALAGCATVNVPVVQPVPLTPAQIATVKDAVARKLKDPAAAIFGMMLAGVDPKGILTVCGMLNARSGYGGYMGMNPYIGEFKGAEFIPVMIGGAAGPTSGIDAVFAVCEKSGLKLSR